MLYHFELQMAGIILLSAMLVCGVFLYIRRRRERLLQESEESRSLYGGGDNPAAAAGDALSDGTEPKDRGGADDDDLGDGRP